MLCPVRQRRVAPQERPNDGSLKSRGSQESRSTLRLPGKCLGTRFVICGIFGLLCHNVSHMAKSNPVATRVAAGGRIVIPAAYRKALGIKPGDDVVLQLESEEIRLYSRKQALRRLQDRVAKAIQRNVSFADELLRERKEEARRG